MEGKNGSRPGGVAACGFQQDKRETGEGSTYDAVAQKAAPYKRMNLAFVAAKGEVGKLVVEMPTSVVMAGAVKWKHTVIAYVLGLDGGFMRSRWSEYGVIKVHKMDKVLFIIQVLSEEVKQQVLEKGPWSFSRRPFILRNWNVGMPLDKPEVDVLPIWIQFPNLPLDLWTAEALSILESCVGVPLFVDRTTSEQSRLAFARVCVEIRVEDELFDEMTVRYASGKKYTQRILYEWVPFKCSKCKKFGHGDVACKAMQEYKGKAVDDEVLTEGVPVVGGKVAALGGGLLSEVPGCSSPSLPVVQQAGQGAGLQHNTVVQQAGLECISPFPTVVQHGLMLSPIVEEGVSAAAVNAKLTYASMVATPELNNNKNKGGTKGSGYNKSSLKANATPYLVVTSMEQHVLVEDDVARAAIKVDLQKAYNIVERDSLVGLLVLGGLRQGDPMSSYLFLLVLEIFNGLMRKAKASSSSAFGFHPKCRQLGITHLSFADDMVLLASADMSSFRVIKETLVLFGDLTSLKLNCSKSRIFFGNTPRAVRDALCGYMEMSEGVLPVKYLGVPLSSTSGKDEGPYRAKISWSDVCLPLAEGVWVSQVTVLVSRRDPTSNYVSLRDALPLKLPGLRRQTTVLLRLASEASLVSFSNGRDR
ncbi:hypothetical protein LIER_19621 [Lithospermum erythrorhizon]|uniref:DUF4283 domain-containing protein n=1 Tax=Lithospermum erythrorhizon TaxID=34254 RepID=A0AAV3QIB6_LITER